jgi:hypothetical protein
MAATDEAKEVDELLSMLSRGSRSKSKRPPLAGWEGPRRSPEWTSEKGNIGPGWVSHDAIVWALARGSARQCSYEPPPLTLSLIRRVLRRTLPHTATALVRSRA